MSQVFTKYIFGFLSLCILFTSCKKEPEVVVVIDKEEFDLEDQKKIGQNLSDLIATSPSYYQVLKETESPEFYAYLNRLLETVVNTNNVENRNVFDWEITIIKDDNMRSVFTIPGGKIFIYTGLLKTINSENELFSILAHEVFYTDKSVILTALVDEYGSHVIGDLLLENNNTTGAIDIAETVYFLKLSTTNVEAADEFAMEIICPFQYEARGLKTFIERASNLLEEIQWLETRPGSSNRLEMIETNAQTCGVDELTFTERYEYNKALLP